MTTSFDTSAAVLDAAGRGATVPGYEAVGGLLLDLAFTVPVVPGAALASSEVAAACAATAPGRLATLAGIVKPSTIVISLGAAALVAGLVLAPAGRPVEVTPDPARSGAARVVATAAPELRESVGIASVAEIPVHEDPAAPIPGSDAVDRFAESEGQGDPTRSDPDGSVIPGASPSPPVPSTTKHPATRSSTSVPSTGTAPMTGPSTTTPSVTTPSTTTAAPLGNNGNDNGNGVGNGKGNQGNGNPDGPRGGGNGGGPPP